MTCEACAPIRTPGRSKFCLATGLQQITDNAKIRSFYDWPQLETRNHEFELKIERQYNQGDCSHQAPRNNLRTHTTQRIGRLRPRMRRPKPSAVFPLVIKSKYSRPFNIFFRPARIPYFLTSPCSAFDPFDPSGPPAPSSLRCRIQTLLLFLPNSQS